MYLQAETDTVVIDNGNAWIYGIDTESSDMESFISAATGYSVVSNLYSEDAYGYGTGSTVVVSDENGVVMTYTVILFGDVNGDGTISEDDGLIVNSYLAGSETVIEAGNAFFAAADVNFDGLVNATDRNLINAGDVSQY